MCPVLFFKHLHHFFDDGCHVVIFIFGQAAAEENIGLCLSCSTVAGCQLVVQLVVDWVVGFHAGFPLRGILHANHCLGSCIDLWTEHFKMLVLNNSCIGDFPICVVHYSIALIVHCLDSWAGSALWYRTSLFDS